MKDVELFVEALESANKYEEGVADAFQAAGRAVKNFFGTSAAAAQRNNAAAQQNAETAKQNQQTAQLNQQANAISPDEAAQKIIDLLNKAFKKDIKTQNKVDAQKAKNEQNQKVEDQMKANAAQKNGNAEAESSEGKESDDTSK